MLITRNCMLIKSRLSRGLTSWLRRVTSWPGGVLAAFISTVLFLAAINYVIVTWCDPALCRMSGNVDIDTLEDFLQKTSRRNIIEDADHWRQIQKRRTKVLEYCRTHPEIDQLDTGMTSKSNSLYYDDKTRTVFCAVPKVACTNWKKILILLGGKSLFKRPEDLTPDIHYSSLLKPLSNLSDPENKRRLETYTKYIFVRHPFERLLSGYLDKFANDMNTLYPRGAGTLIISEYRKNPTNESLRYGSDVTFEEFVKFLLGNSQLRRALDDEHWRPVYAHCQPCRVKYDFIGKYERLKKEAQLALDLMGAEGIHFPMTNYREYRSRTFMTGDHLSQFFANISAMQIRELWKLYYTDFQMFGYEYPDFNFESDLYKDSRD